MVLFQNNLFLPNNLNGNPSLLRRNPKPSTGPIPVVPLASCPAKTFRSATGLIQPGRSVLEHCLIVGAVAREIISRFPEDIRLELFPDGSPLVAASHDIGKISPYFFEKIRRNLETGDESLPSFPELNIGLESNWGGHAGVGQIAAINLNVPEYVPEILGQHHGFLPQVGSYRANDEVFGGPGWQLEREKCVESLKKTMGLSWPQISSFSKARLLGGLTSVADWIGSGEYFEAPLGEWESQVATALDGAGFIPPKFKANLTFQGVFGFSPFSVQEALINQVSGPGVYVLEAPMGMGKTEAALFAAYLMLQCGQSRGVYFALPTQLTSNKIHERFQQFLRSILADTSSHRSLLLHSNAAWLEETEMGEDAGPGGSWFNQAKRGLLAPFAVGTIDQAIMAAMNVKHGSVRAFGLAGKVVILDEVHTYDAYTGTLLDQLIDLLRELRCTVIVLSATLNRERRKKLLKGITNSNGYPLITAESSLAGFKEVSVLAHHKNRVGVKVLESDERAINEALSRAEQGQQVIWIENTVHDAQQRYLDLAARAASLGVDCGLLHSRFTFRDRQEKENNWVTLFGKKGWGKRQTKGRILVGTQVLEQSLDIDGDFLVTRFAPTDLILQRMGRLWRHDDAPRNPEAACEAWLLVSDACRTVSNPIAAFGKSAFVYSPYVLCRSFEVWAGKDCVDLPGDIRDLIEATYEDRQETGDLANLYYELENGRRGRAGRRALQQLAMVSLAQAGKTMPESRAQTRYADEESAEVLVLQRWSVNKKEKVAVLTLLDGGEISIPLAKNRLSKKEWRKLSVVLMRQVVRVRAHDAPRRVSRSKLEMLGLHNCLYLGSREWDEAILRVALLGKDGALMSLDGGLAHEDCDLEYRDDLGYRVIRN